MFPKTKYIRNKRLMEAYRLIPCQNCGAQDGTVCGAHSNQARHGKGRSIKASDIYAASLCHKCHMEIDQGKHLGEIERIEIWVHAHEKTVRELVRIGEWPKNVILPI